MVVGAVFQYFLHVTYEGAVAYRARKSSYIRRSHSASFVVAQYVHVQCNTIQYNTTKYIGRILPSPAGRKFPDLEDRTGQDRDEWEEKGYWTTGTLGQRGLGRNSSQVAT